MNDVFKALADPTRREILLMIAQEPRSVNAVAEAFKMSRPAVSKHIKVLEKNALITISQDVLDGRQRNCYVQLEALMEVDTYLNQLKGFWKQRFDNLDKFLNKDSNK